MRTVKVKPNQNLVFFLHQKKGYFDINLFLHQRLFFKFWSHYNIFPDFFYWLYEYQMLKIF
jgi:hypothetical protein